MPRDIPEDQAMAQLSTHIGWNMLKDHVEEMKESATNEILELDPVTEPAEIARKQEKIKTCRQLINFVERRAKKFRAKGG